MDALELAEKAKKQNIIEMAVGFTATMPLFQGRSVDLIKEKMADLFEGLDRISSDQDFSKMHKDFCQWFVKTMPIRLTQVGALQYDPGHVRLPSDSFGISASLP